MNTKNLILTLAAFILVSVFSFGQEKKKILYYNTELDGEKQITEAMYEAKKENKNIMLIIGEDWCPWCRKLNRYMLDDPLVDSIMKADYVKLKVYYSRKDHKNDELLARLGYPQRFGFPVIIILDKDGNKIHTQDSALLEKDKSYDRKKLIAFLKNWSPTAIDPESYKTR